MSALTIVTLGSDDLGEAYTRMLKNRADRANSVSSVNPDSSATGPGIKTVMGPHYGGCVTVDIETLFKRGIKYVIVDVDVDDTK